MRSPLRRARRAVNDRLSAPRTIERVASLGPVPPAPTGIATYHQAVLDGLERIGFTRDAAGRADLARARPGLRDAARLPHADLPAREQRRLPSSDLPDGLAGARPGRSARPRVRRLRPRVADERRPAGVRRDPRGARGPRAGDAARRSERIRRCGSRGWPPRPAARAGSWCTPSSAVATWNRSAVARRSSWCRIRRWNPRRRSRAPRRPGRGCARPPKRAAPARWWSRPAT